MKIIYLLLAVLYSPHALAGFFIDPYLGYESGKLEEKASIASGKSINISTEMAGVGYGARVGLRMLLVSVGAEYQSGSLGFDGGGNFEPKDVGVFAKMYLPLRVRLWGTYFVKSTAPDVKGKGMKAGIGFRLIRRVFLNVEYIERKYDELIAFPSITLSGKAKTFFVSLSVPLGE